MKLKPELAQSIVDHMMSQIPYNINIMNENGYIIASGDPTRINTLHIGALDAIRQGKTLPMERLHGQHGQPGVNMPITYDDQIIGVVGITGDPAKVVPLASLLKTAVELLLRQSTAAQRKQESAQNQQRFLYHLIQATQTQAPTSELIATAKQFKLDLTQAHTVIAIDCQPNELARLNNDPANLMLMLTNRVGLVIIHDPLTCRRLQKRLASAHRQFGVSESWILIGKAVTEAATTLRLRQNLDDETITSYRQIRFYDLLLRANLPVQGMVDRFNELATSNSGRELIATIWEFIRSDLNVNQTAKHLFIHRNTVNYRLNRIQKIFKLTPQNATDLFKLFIGYLYFVNQRGQQ